MIAPTPGRGPDLSAVDASELPDTYLLLDVREPVEWAAGHAPNATHVPLMQLPHAELEPDVPIAVVCHVGSRSSRAADYLAARGLRVQNVAGGMAAWERAGLPVVRDDGTPGYID